MRKWLCLLLSALLMWARAPALGTDVPDASPQPVIRALLVTCDRFVSREDTTPAAQQNALMLQKVLYTDGRGCQTIRVECDTLTTVEAFAHAARETFADAAEGDISVLYISTHGEYSPDWPAREACLLLSDGQTEERLTAATLANICGAIRGNKVILLDACHSGAFIAKGLSSRAGANPFQGTDIHILCSAGGSEESWYWRAGGEETLTGAGYFTSILTGALTGSCPADRNGDGAVTMAEIKRYMLSHYAASTPQIYPEAGDFVLFQRGSGAQETAAVSDVTFDSTVFSGSVVQIGFSFTVNRPVRVWYQLVYDRHGAWDFENAPMFSDGEAGVELTEGTWQRFISLSLGDGQADAAGYLMLQLYAEEEGRLFLAESRLLRVLPAQGRPSLKVEADTAFAPALGEELAVRVSHAVPCELTVTVQNLRGQTVRTLCLEQPTRPQRLSPEGTCLYWDGRLEDGTMAPPGRYLIRAQTTVAGLTYYAYSTYSTLRGISIRGAR